MKKLITNCLATTALTVLIHAALGCFIYGASLVYIQTIYEILLVNLIVHAALHLSGKYEPSSFITEKTVEIISILIIVIPAGFIFDWYTTNLVWIVAAMCLVVYAAGCIMDIMKVNEDLAAINHMLKERRK